MPWPMPCTARLVVGPVGGESSPIEIVLLVPSVMLAMRLLAIVDVEHPAKGAGGT